MRCHRLFSRGSVFVVLGFLLLSMPSQKYRTQFKRKYRDPCFPRRLKKSKEEPLRHHFLTSKKRMLRLKNKLPRYRSRQLRSLMPACKLISLSGMILFYTETAKMFLQFSEKLRIWLIHLKLFEINLHQWSIPYKWRKWLCPIPLFLIANYHIRHRLCTDILTANLREKSRSSYSFSKPKLFSRVPRIWIFRSISWMRVIWVSRLPVKRVWKRL